MGTLRLLEAIRASSLTHFTRLFQACSSELFGIVKESPQSEETNFHPRSPYGVSKQFSYWTAINHREAYNMHASNGIIYNSESPRRSKEFVTRKITWTVAAIKRNLQECLFIGNLDARRDWSHVKDFVKGMWLMLQQEEGGDYILSSGVARPVREFVEEAFAAVDITLVWTGEKGSIHEKAVDSDDSSRVLVQVDPQFFRPPELFDLVGNSDKARSQLNWQPSISFSELVSEMVVADLAAIDRDQLREVT
jgi:GDPmannose 4,6-dehydratase